LCEKAAKKAALKFEMPYFLVEVKQIISFPHTFPPKEKGKKTPRESIV
jgi:hypothetical protein